MHGSTSGSSSAPSSTSSNGTEHAAAHDDRTSRKRPHEAAPAPKPKPAEEDRAETHPAAAAEDSELPQVYSLSDEKHSALISKFLESVDDDVLCNTLVHALKLSGYATTKLGFVLNDEAAMNARTTELLKSVGYTRPDLMEVLNKLLAITGCKNLDGAMRKISGYKKITLITNGPNFMGPCWLPLSFQDKYFSRGLDGLVQYVMDNKALEMPLVPFAFVECSYPPYFREKTDWFNCIRSIKSKLPSHSEPPEMKTFVARTKWFYQFFEDVHFTLKGKPFTPDLLQKYLRRFLQDTKCVELKFYKETRYEYGAKKFINHATFPWENLYTGILAVLDKFYLSRMGIKSKDEFYSSARGAGEARFKEVRHVNLETGDDESEPSAYAHASEEHFEEPSAHDSDKGTGKRVRFGQHD